MSIGPHPVKSVRERTDLNPAFSMDSAMKPCSKAIIGPFMAQPTVQST